MPSTTPTQLQAVLSGRLFHADPRQPVDGAKPDAVPPAPRIRLYLPPALRWTSTPSSSSIAAASSPPPGPLAAAAMASPRAFSLVTAIRASLTGIEWVTGEGTAAAPGRGCCCAGRPLFVSGGIGAAVPVCRLGAPPAVSIPAAVVAAAPGPPCRWFGSRWSPARVSKPAWLTVTPSKNTPRFMAQSGAAESGELFSCSRRTARSPPATTATRAPPTCWQRGAASSKESRKAG